MYVITEYQLWIPVNAGYHVRMNSIIFVMIAKIRLVFA